MPVVFRFDGSGFTSFRTKETRENLFISTVAKAGADAKFWLYPEIELAYNRGFDARTIKRLQDIVADHRGKIEEAWHEYFG